MEKAFKSDIVRSFITKDGYGHLGVYNKERNVFYLIKESITIETDKNGAFYYPIAKNNDKTKIEKVEPSLGFEAFINLTNFNAIKYGFQEKDLANFRKLCNEAPEFTHSSLINIEKSFNTIMKTKDNIDFENECNERIQEMEDANVVDNVISSNMYNDGTFDKQFSKKNVCYFVDNNYAYIGLYKKLCDEHYDEKTQTPIPETKRVFIPSSKTTYTVENNKICIGNDCFDLKFDLANLRLNKCDIQRICSIINKKLDDEKLNKIEMYNSSLGKSLYTLNELANIESQVNAYKTKIKEYKRKQADKLAHSVYNEF